MTQFNNMTRNSELVRIFEVFRRALSDFLEPYATRFALVMVFGLPWSHAFFYIGFAGLLFCVLFSTNRYRELIGKLKIPMVLFAFMLLVWIVLGTMYTTAPQDMVLYDFRKYRKILLLPILLLVFPSVASARKLVFAYASGVLILMIFTLMDGFHVDKLLGVDLSKYRDQSYNSNSLVYWRNHIVHGFHVSLLFVICAQSAIHLKKFRPLYIFICCICIYDILFFINGRAALLGLMIGILLIVAYFPTKLKYRITVLSLAIGCAFATFALSPKVQQRVMSVVNESQKYYSQNDVTTSGGNRLYFWSKSFELFKSAPIIGTGPGSFRARMLEPDIVIKNFPYHHAHNEYLTLLSQHGVIGLLLFAIFISSIYIGAKSHSDSWLKQIIIISLAIFLVNAATDSSLHNESEGWTLLLLACLAATSRTLPNHLKQTYSGFLGKRIYNFALVTLNQPLKKVVGSVAPRDYLAKAGVLAVLRRSLQRRAIFWLSGQQIYKTNQIDTAWKTGLVLYFGEDQIGDILMDLAPRSLLLKHRLTIDLLTTPHLAQLFAGDPWFRSVYSDPKQLSAANYDFAIVLSNKRRPLATKIKYFKQLPWISIQENYFGPDFHRSGFVTQRFSDLLGIELSQKDFIAAATQKLALQNFSSQSATHNEHPPNAIAVCVGGVDARRSFERWGAVISLIEAHTDRSFILLGSSNGGRQAASLMSQFSGHLDITNMVGKTTLHQAHSIISNCRLIVCTDGGLMHIAATTKTPLIALFASAIPPTWRLQPSAARDAITSHTLNVNDIAPSQIADAVNLRLQGTNSSPCLATLDNAN